MRGQINNCAPSGEDGFTVIEMIVASAITLVIATGAMMLLITGQHQQVNQQTRGVSIDAAQDAMSSIAGEVREAARIDAPAGGATGQILDIRVPVAVSGGNELRLVRYDCTRASSLGSGLRYCTRAQSATAGSGTLGNPVRVIDGVSNTNVFSVGAGSSSRSVTINIDESVSGSTNPVSLTQTVGVRNCTNNGVSLTSC